MRYLNKIPGRKINLLKGPLSLSHIYFLKIILMIQDGREKDDEHTLKFRLLRNQKQKIT